MHQSESALGEITKLVETSPLWDDRDRIDAPPAVLRALSRLFDASALLDEIDGLAAPLEELPLVDPQNRATERGVLGHHAFLVADRAMNADDMAAKYLAPGAVAAPPGRGLLPRSFIVELAGDAAAPWAWLIDRAAAAIRVARADLQLCRWLREIDEVRRRLGPAPVDRGGVLLRDAAPGRWRSCDRSCAVLCALEYANEFRQRVFSGYFSMPALDVGPGWLPPEVDAELVAAAAGRLRAVTAAEALSVQLAVERVVRLFFGGVDDALPYDAGDARVLSDAISSECAPLTTASDRLSDDEPREAACPESPAGELAANQGRSWTKKEVAAAMLECKVSPSYEAARKMIQEHAPDECKGRTPLSEAHLSRMARKDGFSMSWKMPEVIQMLTSAKNAQRTDEAALRVAGCKAARKTVQSRAAERLKR